MGCCGNGDWKREEVPDHKFDFIDVSEFHASGFFSYLRYSWVFIIVIKTVIFYGLDIYTASILLINNQWTSSIQPTIPIAIAKWIFSGCIIFSFLLLAWDARKAYRIIKSRDISYAFTNVMSNRYFTLRSYDHFCLFSEINNNKTRKDEIAFFVFFTFKGWKRLLLAEGPRQVINGLTLFSIAKSAGFTTDFSAYYKGWVQAAFIVSTLGAVLIWAGSALLLALAIIFYIPLLCYIQGNLKEYTCHKVDKRIHELMKRKTRKRLQLQAELARKEALGDFSHLKDKKGNMLYEPLPQPTLPRVDMDGDDKSESIFTADSSDQHRPFNASKQESFGAYGSPYDASAYKMPTLPYAQSAISRSPSEASLKYNDYDRSYSSRTGLARDASSASYLTRGVNRSMSGTAGDYRPAAHQRLPYSNNTPSDGLRSNLSYQQQQQPQSQQLARYGSSRLERGPTQRAVTAQEDERDYDDYYMQPQNAHSYFPPSKHYPTNQLERSGTSYLNHSQSIHFR